MLRTKILTLLLVALPLTAVAPMAASATRLAPHGTLTVTQKNEIISIGAQTTAVTVENLDTGTVMFESVDASRHTLVENMAVAVGHYRITTTQQFCSVVCPNAGIAPLIRCERRVFIGAGWMATMQTTVTTKRCTATIGIAVP